MLKRSVVAAAVLLASLQVRAECNYGFVSAEKLLSPSVWSAVYGDFDGDGRVDVALQAQYDTRLVFLNRGNRVFQPVNKVSIGGSFADPLAAAFDVNGDGVVDLVYRGRSSSVEVALGHGNGEFGSLITSPVAFSDDWRLIDINGDGRKDFVEYFTGRVTAELSLGDGRFGPTQTLASASISQNDQFAVGDFDGDGFPDLYVAGVSFSGGVAFHQSIFWNDGKGGFPTHTEVVTPGFTVPEMMLDAYDFDGDGAADLLLRDAGGPKLLRGRNRSLTLQPVVVADALLNSGGSRFSGLGDFDADGHPDALFENGTAVWGPPSAARIDGTVFDVPNGAAASGAFNTGAHVADVNGDGIADIVGTGSGGGLFVVYGKSHSRHLDGGTMVQAAAQIAGFATGDVNGDGLTDVVVSFATSGDFMTFLADGKGGFSPQPKQTVSGSSSGGIGAGGLADFDGDGKLDLLYGQGLDVKVLFGDGSGQFSNPVTYPNARPIGTARTAGTSKSAAVVIAGGNVQLLSLSADRSFVASSVFPAPTNGAVFPVDVDGDGVTDLVVADYGASTTQVVRSTSNGWVATQLPARLLSEVTSLAVGDVDGDGRNDIVTCGSSGCQLTLATSSGYAVGEDIPSLGFPSGVAIADVDHDGHAEIVMLLRGNYGDPLVLTSVRYRGTGHFDTVNFANANGAGPFFLADVDGDGAIDAVVLSFFGLDILRNGCTAPRIRAGLGSSTTPFAGDRPTLVVNVEPSSDFAGLVTVKEGSATLGTHQPDLFGEYATSLFPLPPLTAGVHVYTISYDDQYSGHQEETFSVTVLPSTPRKRAVHH